MADVPTAPINGVAHSQLGSQHEAPNNAQPAIKRKRVDGSEDEAQMNGNAPHDVKGTVSSASVQEQIANFITVLKR